MKRNKKKIIRSVTVSMSCIFFEEIMHKMRARGYEMLAVTSSGPELDKLKDDGFHCYEVPMQRHISPIKDLVALLKLILVFYKEKPYVVHSMTPKAGLLCMIAGWLTRVPVRIHMFTGLVWPTSVGLKRKILMATDWITCACATHVLPEGEGVMNDLISGAITKKPMKVLGYGNVMGVDMDRFNPKRFGDIDSGSKSERPFTFIFVGRIVGDKGINELVEAFTLLNETYPNTRLMLVGPYENNLDPVSEKTKKCIDTNSAIVATGSKRGDELLNAYMESDCHIMPSYREGFPNTPMEAGAIGLPNILTDINGSREIVVSLTHSPSPISEKSIKICDNGIIVPPRTVQPLYEAMEIMLTDTKMREHMKLNARPMIESRFEKSYVQSCLVSYYEKVIGE